LAGFATTATALVAVNFLVEPNWIPLYWSALNMPQKNMSAMAQFMPDFYGVFFWTGHAAVAVVLGAALVGVILWRLRNLPFELAMPICILGGLIAAPHTGNNDLVLAIPACLAVARQFPQLRVGVGVLLSPIVMVLAILAPPSFGPAITVGVFLWLMVRVPPNSVALKLEPSRVRPAVSTGCASASRPGNGPRRH
jgi:hypothetical protein